jgi:hypothetical protein
VVVAVVVVRAGLSSQPRIVLRMRRAPNRERLARGADVSASRRYAELSPTLGQLSRMGRAEHAAVANLQRRRRGRRKNESCLVAITAGGVWGGRRWRRVHALLTDQAGDVYSRQRHQHPYGVVAGRVAV